jgi:hypothetical protein
MPEFVLLAAIVQLGNEFRRRGMEAQLERLRRFYKGLTAAQRSPSASDEMTMESVIEWLCILRIPPFADVYKALPPGTDCPSCGGEAKFVAYTRSVFPGGSVSACKSCGASWLQELKTEG